jgi:predicted O-methyltransferase YrrM
VESAAPDRATELAAAWHVCRWASIPPIWGRVLMRLVRELAPRSLLELGTGLGLSGAYQGAAMELASAGQLVTLDVHEAGRIAERGYAELGLAKRIEHVPGYIDQTLPEVLERHRPVDFAFLDAEHTEAATTRHFDLVLPHLADGAVVVLDDTNQTEEMRRAWRTVIANQRVTLALPLRRVGIVVV